MILFKFSLIIFTTLTVVIWVMPVTSSLDSKDNELAHTNPIVVALRGMK